MTIDDFDAGYRLPGGSISTSVDSVRACGGRGQSWHEGCPSGREKQPTCREGNPDVQQKIILKFKDIIPQTTHIEPIVSPPETENVPGGVLSRCVECGKEFAADQKHQKYCCKKCYQRHANRLYIERHRSQVNEHRNEYRKRKRAEAKAERLEISVEELMRRKEQSRRGSPTNVRPVIGEGWKDKVREVLSISDPSERYRLSKSWSDEERIYAKSLALEMIREDYYYRREAYC